MLDVYIKIDWRFSLTSTHLCISFWMSPAFLYNSEDLLPTVAAPKKGPSRSGRNSWQRAMVNYDNGCFYSILQLLFWGGGSSQEANQMSPSPHDSWNYQVLQLSWKPYFPYQALPYWLVNQSVCMHTVTHVAPCYNCFFRHVKHGMRLFDLVYESVR